MSNQIKFLHQVVKKQYFKLFLLATATVIYVSMNLLQPILFGFIIDNVVNQEPITNGIMNVLAEAFGGVGFIRNNLWVGALLILLTSVIGALMIFSRSRLNGLISENVAFNIKDGLFKHLMFQPYKYFVTSKTGDLIQRATSDIDTVRRVFAGQIGELIYAVSIVIIAFIVMFSINVKLALTSAILLPIIFIFAIVFFIYVRKRFEEYETADSNLTHAISENLAATRVIKAFNRELYESEVFDKVNQKISAAGIKMIDALAFYWGVSDFICFSSILLVSVVGIIMVANNQISIGQVIIFTSYSGLMVWPLRNMGRIIADLGKVSVSISRIVEVIDEPMEDLETGQKFDFQGHIELKDVRFAYDDDPYEILKGVTLEIQPSQSVAILGPTGAGKSSLIHILTGLYDYESGSIKIDGVELSDINKHHLRENISVVLQEPFLFSKSVKENIVIAKQSASHEQIASATHIAHVEDFIRNFEAEYETLIGERGTTLSGGQKQRVAIARTLINDAPIIIFDDSLSAVDTQTDKEIRTKLKELKNKATTIIITQRIASAKDADQIFVLEDGIISQAGTHEELLNESGLYQRINEVQSKMEVGE
ncbi:MAG: ABC transporter ATP-binding protein [Erysipelothrix sp.]|nr:ABC transporter ATP-binding protein [Erysipelothrix sp.]